MRIPLSEFVLPGTPGVPGNVIYTAIDYDINSGKELDGYPRHNYFVCGWREDDGLGVLVHGTKDGGVTRYDFRVPRLISAPKDEEAGIIPVQTQFHGVESLPGPYIRLVGCVRSEGKEILQGFLYEGVVDGSGDWYPVTIPGSESTIVKASKGEIVLCVNPEEPYDRLHIFSLSSSEWREQSCGYDEEWEVDEIIPAGEIYVIRLLHSDGRHSNVTYKVAK